MNTNTPPPTNGRRSTPGSGGPYRRRQRLGGVPAAARDRYDSEAVSQVARTHAFNTALRLDDLDRAFRLARRLRHPDGPILTDLATIGELLERMFPVPERPPRGVPAEGWGILAWPSPLNDLVELTEAAPPELLEVVITELSRLAYGLVRGAPLAVLPGQEDLQRFRRVLVPPPQPTVPAAVIIATDPSTRSGQVCVELLAVLPAGPLVTAFYAPVDAPDDESGHRPEPV